MTKKRHVCSCYRTYAHFNRNCLAEFARSRTAALRTAALLHVLFGRASLCYQLSIFYTLNAWLQANTNNCLYKENEVTLNFIFGFEFAGFYCCCCEYTH